MLNSMTRLLHESEKKELDNLMTFLKKSTGFYGVIEFDNEQVPLSHPEEIQSCRSLVVVTLTVVALSLPKTASYHVKGLLASTREGLQFVTHIEESLNANGELVKARKAARQVWTNVEVYCRWLQIDLQNKARKGKTPKEILQWLCDEAAKIVIQFKTRKNVSLDHSLCKFIAYHEDAIEKREDNVRTTAQLLGRSIKILKMLKNANFPTYTWSRWGTLISGMHYQRVRYLVVQSGFIQLLQVLMNLW
ncbi:unnamed protein product [Lactuca saligna]|uniref:Uncharacterized protein n=1 Tax=Lactuca saligna TaxID=75948 RepID=A0AA35VR98_LACSI|nr:unnamed protein product [Lactuca saligna]